MCSSDLAENVVLAETEFPRGWFQIDDYQSIVWDLVRNVPYTYNTGMMLGGALFGDVPYSSLGGTGTSVGQNWTDIDDTQTNTWTDIDDSQG